LNTNATARYTNLQTHCTNIVQHGTQKMKCINYIKIIPCDHTLNNNNIERPKIIHWRLCTIIMNEIKQINILKL